MCGICGFVIERSQQPKVDWRQTLVNMTALQRHRGPDQDGHYFAGHEQYLVGLGHRRLSIIDLSEQGRQPMANEDGSVIITFNGEIYNYRELHQGLSERNHAFRSTSDTETIVHLYEEEGTSCVYKLNGMFGLGVWDARHRTLFLARDRLGIKPLFYSPLGNGIAFASELKSLLELPGFVRRPRPAQIDQYLTFGYVPGPQTVFEGIYALPAGYWLTWREGIIETGRYWYPPVDDEVTPGRLSSLVDGLDALLNVAVRSHLVADVPVGAFLSGGVDSSLVCAIAQRYLKEPLQTFSIGFGGGGDELPYARMVADHIGSQHYERLAEPDLTARLPSFVWHLEQPLFDNSIIPTFLVSQLARERCKVVLAGDGGDEPFFGYGWTRAAIGIPGIALPGAKPRGWRWNYRGGLLGKLQRAQFDLTHSGLDRYLRRMTTAESFRRWLYAPGFSEQQTVDPQDELAASINSYIVKNWRERFIMADLLHYLPGDILFKVDRMSMAHSLEVRPPLLDYRVVEWALRLPWQLRYAKGVGKVLLRMVAQRYLPEPILKPRKQGFTIPIGSWLRGPTGQLAAALFRSSQFARRGMIAPQSALRLLQMHRSGKSEVGHRIWSVLMLEIWCRVWLDQQSPNQTLEQMLHETGDL
jgi:asparagine synthase (glutamine-hydrolysing)